MCVCVRVSTCVSVHVCVWFHVCLCVCVVPCVYVCVSIQAVPYLGTHSSDPSPLLPSLSLSLASLPFRQLVYPSLTEKESEEHSGIVSVSEVERRDQERERGKHTCSHSPSPHTHFASREHTYSPHPPPHTHHTHTFCFFSLCVFEFWGTRIGSSILPQPRAFSFLFYGSLSSQTSKLCLRLFLCYPTAFLPTVCI